MTILGEITPEHFLKEYWQKKPLLVRDAFPDFSDSKHNPISPEQLFEMASQDNVNSRIVIENKHAKEVKDTWQVKYGPFSKKDYSNLPKVNWSILVADADKHHPEIRQYLNPFRFIPDWRIDDLMISYAPPGSSVGAHVDDYDVFILQTQGTRQWEIDTNPKSLDLVDQVDLKILKKFKPTDKWILEPGDMLYLPPGIPHHGIAIPSKSYGYDCMSWSIGFRAPSYRELINAFPEAIMDKIPDQRYSDNDLIMPSNPGEITKDTIEKIFNIIKSNLTIDKQDIIPWFGCYITEPQHEIIIEEPKRTITPSDLNKLLEKHYAIMIHPAVQIAYIKIPKDKQSYLFINGEKYLSDTSFAEALCLKHYITQNILEQFLDDEVVMELIATLVNMGYLITTQNE